MYSCVTAGAVHGMDSYLMKVETDISAGLPVFHMVGIPGTEVREAVERVRVSLRNSGFSLPASRITVNFTPADIPKRNVVLDLPVACGILICIGVIKQESLDGVLVAGELGLNGEIRPVGGILPIVMAAAGRMKRCVIPRDNLTEGGAAEGIKVTGVSALKEFIDYINTPDEKRDGVIQPERTDIASLVSGRADRTVFTHDLSMVRGQKAAKRVLEIAAAGLHNALLIGTPGSGKSMLADCVPEIMPPLTKTEALEVSSVYSVAGRLRTERKLVTERPIAKPHSSISVPALLGGGSPVRPGEISLAHRGVLFMDEFPHFGSEKINALRIPLEEGRIRISRSSGSFVFPSRFMLIAASNPCPCGYFPDMSKCRCTPFEINRYFSSVSGPVTDRMDLCVRMEPVKYDEICSPGTKGESSAARARIKKAWMIQQERFRDREGMMNSDMQPADLERYCRTGREAGQFVRDMFERTDLTVRGYHRILRCARTIADLAGQEQIGIEHLAEAASYRMDRQMGFS
ncbi:MAG: YifB family Mg chelatase-like AAA ATPase [Lachnospiraceae bacterium]|nr:YifB family Mg chelatase-like AAA ATPase [Lachnospiraceae bacterium]